MEPWEVLAICERGKDGLRRHAAFVWRGPDRVIWIEPVYFWPPVSSHAMHVVNGKPKEKDGVLTCGGWKFESAEEVGDISSGQMDWAQAIKWNFGAERERLESITPELVDLKK